MSQIVSPPHRFARLKRAALAAVPLAVRKVLVRAMGTRAWIPRRYWWQLELLRDYAAADTEGFHRFLWRHHLAYAESYSIAQRFGTARLHLSRRLLLDDLVAYLQRAGVDPARDVTSVLDVGCSLGYVLRHLETDVFPAARVLDGFDVDEQAITQGQAYLAQRGSRIQIRQGDLLNLDPLLRGRTYDVVLVAGVLLYLRQDAAAAVIQQLLQHTRLVLALAGLAAPERDNATLAASEARARDNTLIHNFDAMVAAAGGEVVYRRWEGARDVDGNTIYFVFARPGGG